MYSWFVWYTNVQIYNMSIQADNQKLFTSNNFEIIIQLYRNICKFTDGFHTKVFPVFLF